MNLPNRLSILRAALIPLMVLFLALGRDGNACWWIGGAVFGVAAFTDYLDGQIARSRGIVTDFGKFIDPVADKLLLLSAMIMLLDTGLMPAWAVVIVLARELSVDGLRMVAVGKGRVIAAGKLGKVKTVSQIALVGWLMASRQSALTGWVGPALLACALGMTVWSGVDYFVKNGRCVTEDL